MKTIVQFGAGNIGRSLVGQLFSSAGYEVIFVDMDRTLIDAINEKGAYTIRIKDNLAPGQKDTLTVTHIRGIHAQDEAALHAALRDTDLISTAVGARAIEAVIKSILRAMEVRGRPVSVLMCENARGAAHLAREWVQQHQQRTGRQLPSMGFIQTSIGKMVPLPSPTTRGSNPLEVSAEAYAKIIADREGFVDEPPEVPGLELKRNFEAYMDRKLFIHNLGHAVAAYQGYLAGARYIWEALEVPWVRHEVLGAMWESARALIDKYPSEFDTDNQREHIEDLVRRFGNRALGDTVYRVGRDLSRKLGPEDRCAGALRLISQHGHTPLFIHRCIAAACCFKATDEAGAPFPEDVLFHQELAQRGIEEHLRATCGLDGVRDRPSLDHIRLEYERIQSLIHHKR